MTHLSSEIRIKAPKEKVWAILADLGGIQNFHPGVKKSYYTSETKEGLGASRVCELIPMGKIEESVTEWREGEEITLAIFPKEKAPPFQTAHGRVALRQDGQGTIVTLTVDYALKFGPLGSLMDVLMVRPQFRKAVPGVLAGLKHYAETGELVDRQVFKRIQHVAVPA
ncbi:MAG: SRPBCC family protein [Acidobacteria bacterium]|nr:SRPBCC family protein [Acidobacteriota bacterium]